MLLNNEWVNKSREKSKDNLKHENEHTTMQNLWDTGKAILREKGIALHFSKMSLSQKTRKGSNKQSKLTLKGI